MAAMATCSKVAIVDHAARNLLRDLLDVWARDIDAEGAQARVVTFLRGFDEGGEVQWTEKELEQVAAATAPPKLYPHWMLERQQRR